MSGGGGGLAAPERVKRGKQSKRKKKKRVGFVLDMTPLVDITFLLLTFFMFTTTMATPQVMEMSIPPEIFEKVEVRENELLTLLVRQDGKLFWHIANDDPQVILLKDIRKMSEVENLRPGIENKLIIVLKPSDDAPYGTVISVLDQLNMAEIKIVDAITKLKDEQGNPMKRKRKFTLAPLSDEEKDKIGGM
jgi:biopolymer transport protein ExbD